MDRKATRKWPSTARYAGSACVRVHMNPLSYLSGYPPELQEQAGALLEAGELGPLLASRYPGRHDIRSNRDLHDYVQELKARHLRTAPPLGKVLYDDRLQVVENALGLHTTITRAHGRRVHKRRELRVAGLFREVAPEFLRMIVVHELAHTKHADHSRDFYRLCTHMEPDYHRLELDLRLLLTVQHHGG